MSIKYCCIGLKSGKVYENIRSRDDLIDDIKKYKDDFLRVRTDNSYIDLRVSEIEFIEQKVGR